MKSLFVRALDAAALADKLDEAKEELFNLRFQMATNQLDNTSRLRHVRREVARINTVIREQEIAAWKRLQEDE